LNQNSAHEPGTWNTEQGTDAASTILRELSTFGRVLAIKLYRIRLEAPPPVPILPCLDHEAQLHEGVSPHMAAYVQERASGDIHEVVFIPARRRIEVDTFSTWGESTPQSRDRLLGTVSQRFPGYTARVIAPSWWRGDQRVAVSCRAQVTLRDVLLGTDVASVKAGIERLQAIASLMEKQSRVASWGIRTVTGPLLAAAGVAVYLLFGLLSLRIGESAVTALRYTLIGALGAWIVYYGLKAVQLTEMSNRVWKRTAEYNLILSERRRLGS
jgi:hypothetical protein